MSYGSHSHQHRHRPGQGRPPGLPQGQRRARLGQPARFPPAIGAAQAVKVEQPAAGDGEGADEQDARQPDKHGDDGQTYLTVAPS